jgi:NAD(P)-dependent dehydrogenase (short-subunit alcohol dehydrogenase family)
MNVAGARILVVGGVRRLGRALALDLAAHDAQICITTRSTGPRSAATVASLLAAGATVAHAVPGDVRDPAGAARLVDQAGKALGGLDVLVYAASGTFEPTMPQDIGESSWDTSFDTIAKGFFFTACAARELFTKEAADDHARRVPGHSGVIVALTDTLGLHPWAAFAAHGAAKAAQIHLVKELARAWAADGVRVCGIAPGPVELEDDERREAAVRAAGKGVSAHLIPPSDIGSAVRFCIETDSLTGVNVIVDNGSLLSS